MPVNESMFATREAAEEWQRGAAARNEAMGPATRRMLEAAAIVPGSRVLDLGAGTGDTTLMAAQLTGETGRVVAIDISAPMLEIAAEQARDAGLSNVTTRVMDGSALDFEAGSFDAVIARHALQFISDTAAGLRGIHRALTPGGRVAAVVWGPPEANRYGWLAVASARRLGLVRVDEATVMRPYALGDAEKLEAALIAAGFEGVGIERLAGVRRAPSLETALEWATHGPIFLTLAARLTETERTKLEGAIAEDLQAFVDGEEIAGPMELLVVSATR